MSVQALSWVFDHSPTVGTDRLVLLSLANHAGKQPVDGAWEAWPGIATIAREAGISERTVTNALARLTRVGAIERVINGAPDSRLRADRRPNLYRITGPDDISNGVLPDDTPSAPRGVASARHGVSPDASRGVASARHGVSPHAQKTAPIRKEPSLNRTNEPSLEPAPPSAPPSQSGPLSRLLAELMVGNGCKPPTTTAAWFTEERRLIETDRRDPVEAEKVLRWCQADSFWKGNILSLPKFRAQYDKLRLAMQRAAEPAPWARPDRTNRNPANIYGEDTRVGGGRRIQ